MLKASRTFWSAVQLGRASLILTVCHPAFGAAVPEGIWVRPGYELTVAVDGIQAPRFLAFGKDGTLFVSVPSAGKIYLCKNADGDGRFEKVIPFVEGKNPSTILQGMQYHDDWLWFAQLNSISRARDSKGDGKSEEEVQVLGQDFLLRLSVSLGVACPRNGIQLSKPEPVIMILHALKNGTRVLALDERDHFFKAPIPIGVFAQVNFPRARHADEECAVFSECEEARCLNPIHGH